MKRKSIIYTVILMLVLSVTVGFSAFVSEMSISNIVADIRVKKDIRITDVSLVSESSNDVVPNELNYDTDSVLANVTFNSTSSYVTYKVTITNIGNAEMGIFQINNLPEGVSYEITDYDLKDKICDSDNNCNLGISKEINVKFFPSSDSGVATHDLNAEFDFRQFYTITYNYITNNGYPTEIIAGDNLSVTFTNDIPSSVTVYSDGVAVSSSLYSYSGGVFTYNSVSSDLVIEGPKTFVAMMKNGAVSDSNVNFGSSSGLSTLNNTAYVVDGTEDDENPIYYYRGNVTNNNVLFANFCWKIVRTTETGGTKLIYNGVPAADGSCNNTGTDSQLSSTSKFNSSASSPADVGYMYGTYYRYSSKTLSSQSEAYIYGNNFTWDGTNYSLNEIEDNTTTSSDWSTDRTTLATKYHYTCFDSDGVCESIYYIHYFGNESTAYYLTLTGGKSIEDAKDEMFTNTTDSKIKSVIDGWYASNMTDYTSMLEDAVWCNDRSLYSGSLKSKDTDAGTGDSYFEAYGRNVSTTVPLLSCSSTRDSFTVNSSNGNGKLTYPVGLLTADEYTLAGSGNKGYSTSSYLYTGQYQWSLSPYTFASYYTRGFALYSFGYLSSGDVNDARGVRPSVSLESGTLISSGDGSVSKPYVVKSKVVKVESGDIDTVGSIVSIGDEKFYVIGQEDGNVKLLSMYNLHVGNKYDDENGTVALTNPTGIQDSTAIGWFDGYSADNPVIGAVTFSDTGYWSSSVSSYPSYVYNSSSTTYNYVENYKSYLEGLGATIKDARLISYEELEELGCSGDDNSCNSAPSWVYSTTYWSGSALATSNVWVVASYAYFGGDNCGVDGYDGVRPVIEISTSEF